MFDNGNLPSTTSPNIAADLASQRVHLCGRLYRRLAELAISHASSAFNDGEMEEASQLSELRVGGLPGDKELIGMDKTNLQTADGRADLARGATGGFVFRAMQHN